jgi:phosphoketolase
MSANPHANGGLLRKPLRLPDFRAYAQKVDHPGQVEAEKYPLAWRIHTRRDESEHGPLSRLRP